MSLFTTLVVVGLPIWFLSWGRLQHDAAEPAARQSPVRRIYLFLVLGTAMLTLLGSGAFTLYQLIRLALGERWTGGQTRELINAASSAAAAGLFLAYHLRVVRRDAAGAAAAAPATIPAGPALALLLIHAATPELLEDFRRRVARASDGVDVELLDIDRDDADDLLSRARTSAPTGEP